MRPLPKFPIWIVIDKLGDLTAIPEAWSIHLFSIQIGFFDKLYGGAFNLARVWYRDTPSLFMNGVIFMQVRAPFWIGIQVRPFTAHFLQCGLGWKGNGRLAALLRIQTDESAAAGMDGANFGQADFMNDGTK